MSDAPSILCRRATIDEIYALRFAVLRSGEAPVKLYFPGDDAAPPATWHFGAFSAAGENLACLTLFAAQFEGAPAIQLRGMAVADDCRGSGVGTQLLAAAEGEIRADPRVNSLSWWCNARLTAIRFYEKNGWRIVSEEFLIEKYGPHRRMVKPAV